MSYALQRPSWIQRSGMLGIVIGLHVVIGLGIWVSKVVIPEIIESPMIVDLITPMPTPVETPAPKPQPVVQPQPKAAKVPHTPAPVIPAPVIEASRSSAPTAPLATPPAQEHAPASAPAAVSAPAEPVTQARFDADYLRNPAPPYPPLSKRMGEEGKVVLRVSVSAQGTADSVDIKTSSGSQRLDEAAQRTVRNWKFVPAKRGDTAIQSWVLVPIIFKLEQ